MSKTDWAAVNEGNGLWSVKYSEGDERKTLVHGLLQDNAETISNAMAASAALMEWEVAGIDDSEAKMSEALAFAQQAMGE